jgi:hypothetical protein
MGVVVPGRCPGLSHYAPLGRKTGAALKAISCAIVTPRCNRSHSLPSGGGREENAHRLATSGLNRTATLLVVFNPNGVTGDSPGQRPGFGIKVRIASPVGAKPGDATCASRVDIWVGRTWGIAPFQGLGFLWAL